jgi:hypothetical protein
VTVRATRATVAGRAYLDLQNLARRQGRPTDELHQIYALEGFLARLAVPPYADKLVLKGGVLLAAYDTRRPTVAETIRDEEVYTGVRVTITGELSVAKLTLHIDVNVGDPIWPSPRPIMLPRLLAGQLELVGYPLSMVHAEKVLTAVQRGAANTRWRDFADVYALARRHDMEGNELVAAVTRVAEHRQVRLVPLSEVLLDGYARLAQHRWVAWRRKHRLDDRLPERFEDVLQLVTTFADPVLTGAVIGRFWSATALTWQPAQRFLG